MNEERIIKMLIAHEGIRLQPYRCTSGKLTIGVGRNLDDVGITPSEAMSLLQNDIRRVISELEENLPFWDDLTLKRKEALIDMCFNLGLTRFMGFKKMLKALEIRDWKEAKKQALDSRWAKQVGQRAIDIADMICQPDQ